MPQKTVTLNDLKKQLAHKSKEQLITEIATLYKTFPQVKEYYQAQQADIVEIAQKYKDIIIKEFISSNHRMPPKARFSVARKALNDFKKLTNEPALIADMMLTYVESASHFCTEYGPDVENYYASPENLFAQTLAFIQKHNLLDDFQDRAYNIVRKATDGWGHQDSLRESYEEFYE